MRSEWLIISVIAEDFREEELTPKPVTRTDTANSEGDEVLLDRICVLAGPWFLMIVEVSHQSQYAEFVGHRDCMMLAKSVSEWSMIDRFDINALGRSHHSIRSPEVFGGPLMIYLH